MVERIEKTSQSLQTVFKRVFTCREGLLSFDCFDYNVLAISVVFMQTKLLQVQNELTKVNAQIEEKKTELDDAKQEVNELIRSERLKEIANSKKICN